MYTVDEVKIDIKDNLGMIGEFYIWLLCHIRETKVQNC